MHAHRIEVLNRTDDDAVVVPIAHDLHFKFFPPNDGLFQQYLGRWRHLQAVSHNELELLPVVRNAATCAAQCKRRTNNGGEADVCLLFKCLVKRVRDFCARAFEPNLGHRDTKQVAVLSHVDRFPRGSDQFHLVFLENAFANEIERTVQCGLSAHRRQQRVRPFFLDDSLDSCPVNRLDIGRVGHIRVSHDGRRIRVHQNDPESLLAKRLAGLGTRIVKLAGLADDNRSGADDQDAVNICAFWHLRCVYRLEN